MPDNQQTIAPLRILIIDDESNIRLQLSLCLEAAGHHVVGHGNIHDALAEASWQAFDLIFLDLRLGTDNGLDFIPRLLAENPWTRVVVITAYASVDTAVEAMKRGASDYLAKPFTPAQVDFVTRKVAERRLLERRVEALQLALGDMDPEADLASASPAMERALELARRAATSQATVLIRGELGTGKGRLARAIHEWSKRAKAPFATVHCHAAAPDLLEMELFGVSPKDHRDSPHDAPGWIQFCDGGTLFLEEVGDLPPSLQPKVLRLLRDKEYERFNEFKPRPANVRVVATTSVDLRNAVEHLRFLPDLHLALSVVHIDIPPLRQRPEDVQRLAMRYLTYFARENHRTIVGFNPRAWEVLTKYSWPGNVRELRNVVERAVIMCKSDNIELEHLPPNLLTGPTAYSIGDLVPMDTVQELHIRGVVASTRSIRSAAEVLGIHPDTIVRRLKRTGLDAPKIRGEAHKSSQNPPGASDDQSSQ
ncbi:MAG: sigma-54 dependent transcriptional regulator [Tepidisphaeraceae bacterium]